MREDTATESFTNSLLLEDQFLLVVKMSQLPPPNFGHLPSPFNVSGFPAWPAVHNHGTVSSIFGRPQSPSLAFPPRLPMNSFPYLPVSQLRPGIWPNMNTFPRHVPTQPTTTHNSSPSQGRPQVTNIQRKTNEVHKNHQMSSVKNQELHCDACQKEFTSKETLNAHLGSHVQCSYDGCLFKASRKVLKLHWIQVHASGKMRIKLDTPEEIAKWREERKRKYPTLANVEKRKEEEAKRRASGQVLKTKNFRYRRGQRGGRTFHQGGRNHFNNRQQGRRQDDMNDKGTIDSPPQTGKATPENGNQERRLEDSKSVNNGGDPLSFVLGGFDGEDESDTECEIKEKSSLPSMSPNTEKGTDVSNGIPGGNPALASLCSAYASDSDENEDQTDEVNNKERGCGVDEDINKKPEICKDVESMTKIKSEERQQTKGRPRRFQKRKKKSKSEINPKSLGIRKSTLLEKLLAPEIRRERNVILQCVRHIIKKNFFGVEEATTSPPTNTVKS